MSKKTTGKITVTHLHYESRMVPMVIVGKTDNHETIYVRFRWRHLSIRLDSREPPPNGGAEGKWIYEATIGNDPYAGHMSYEDLRAHTEHIINWPDDEPEQQPFNEADDFIL